MFAGEGAQDYLGEPVSVAVHMRQAGALAEAAGAPPEQVAAGRLDDVGAIPGGTRRGGGGLAGPVVRPGGDRTGPAARGGQAVPVRSGAGLLRQAVAGLGVHAVGPGWADGRGRGGGVRGAAV